MLTERLQILVTPEQRRRLELAAERRGVSVGSLVREAVDAEHGSVTSEDRLAALEGIRSLNGTFIETDEINRIVEEERDRGIPPASSSSSR